MFKDKHGQGGLVAAFISILVATIVVVGVAIPVLKDVKETNNITTKLIGATKLINGTGIGGIAGTIVNIFPLMIGLVLFVAVATLITVRG